MFSIRMVFMVPGLLGALALFTGACSSQATSGNDSLNQVSSAFCSKAVSCKCAGVEQSSCTSNVSTTYKLVGFDTKADYSTDSVNKCTSAIQALGCPAEGAACEFTVPSACPGGGATLPIVQKEGATDAGAPPTTGNTSSSGGTGTEADAAPASE